MKKIIAFCLVLIFVFALSFPYSAYADPFGLMELSSIAYAMQSSFGFSFIPDNATSSGITNIMSKQLTKYINSHGGSITDLFGEEAARLVSGKLVVAQTMVNGIINFTNWMIDEFGLDEAAAKISKGFIGNIEIGEQQDFEETEIIPQVGYAVSFSGTPPYAQYGRTGYNLATAYLDGQSFTDKAAGTSRYYTGQWYIGDGEVETQLYILIPYWVIANSYHPERDYLVTPGYGIPIGPKAGFDITNILTASLDPDYDIPDLIDPGWSWEGEMDGWSGPDTNLEDFYKDLLDHILSEDLIIDGEIVGGQPIPPEPTPAPIEPDTPLQDVPWEGLDDLIGSTTDEITEAQDATTEAVESLTESIEGALDTPSGEELPQFKFDLRELFPFCIPFDIYRLLSSFDAEPQAPHVQLPIVIDSIGFSYTLDLDFSAWNPVAQAMRTAELIVYAIALAWATGKVIKW